jgi:hypothetical protein
VASGDRIERAVQYGLEDDLARAFVVTMKATSSASDIRLPYAAASRLVSFRWCASGDLFRAS